MTNYKVSVAGREHSVTLLSRSGSTLSFIVDGREESVTVAPVATQRAGRGATVAHRGAALTTEVRAPMPGIISEVKVAAGQSVQPGDTLLVIEAMKMENPIRSPRAGTISAVKIIKGQEVQGGALLLEFES